MPFFGVDKAEFDSQPYGLFLSYTPIIFHRIIAFSTFEELGRLREFRCRPTHQPYSVIRITNKLQIIPRSFSHYRIFSGISLFASFFICRSKDRMQIHDFHVIRFRIIPVISHEIPSTTRAHIVNTKIGNVASEQSIIVSAFSIFLAVITLFCLAC
jgi:hypothetical protein